MRVSILLIFIISFTSNFSLAQISSEDSMAIVIEKMKDDTSKVNKLNDAATKFKLTGEFDKSIKLAKKALKISEKIKFELGKGDSFFQLGSCYYYQGNFKEALNSFIEASKISEKQNNVLSTANVYLYIGVIYWQLKNYDEALINLHKALALQKSVNSIEAMALSMNNIGMIYCEKSLRTNNPDSTNALLNKALECYNSCIEGFNKSNNKSQLANTYNNIAVIYDERKQYEKAIKIYFEVLKIKEFEQDKDGVIACYTNIGGAYNNLKRFKEAAEYLYKALKLAQQVGLNDRILEIYSCLSNLEKLKGNWKGAYDFSVLYSKTKDSIYDSESQKQIAEIQTKYETEKKDAEINLINLKRKKETELAESESKRQKTIISSVTIGLVFVAILLLIVFRNLKTTRKQKSIIEIQKKEVESKNHQIAEAYEQLHEKNKEVMDSIHYAARIQRSLITSERYIASQFKRLRK